MNALKGKFNLCGSSGRVAHDATYRVKYLGSTLNPEPGIRGIKRAVATIQAETKSVNDDKKEVYWLKVNEMGVSFLEEKGSVKDNFMDLRKISYCTWCFEDTDVFAFNHHISKDRVECHAVQCEDSKAARDLSMELYSAFKGAHFSDLRESRQISRNLAMNNKQSKRL